MVSNINRISLIAIIAMVIISFTNLLGMRIAGISVLLGVVFFFVNKAVKKQTPAESGLDFKAIGANLKQKSIWPWLILPLVMDGVSLTLAKLFLTEYIGHVVARAGIFVSFDKVILLIAQLVILALGEEIAWRGFFQKQLQKKFPIAAVLVFSSLLFALGHIVYGNPAVVIYDVFFVFINSLLYGIIFYKIDNVWLSTISHFAANLFSILILVFL